MIRHDGQWYGCAAEIAAALGNDVTEAMLRNWSQRDGLDRYRVGRTVYYRLDQAAEIEQSKRQGGRGRRRTLQPA